MAFDMSYKHMLIRVRVTKLYLPARASAKATQSQHQDEKEARTRHQKSRQDADLALAWAFIVITTTYNMFLTSTLRCSPFLSMSFWSQVSGAGLRTIHKESLKSK